MSVRVRAAVVTVAISAAMFGCKPAPPVPAPTPNISTSICIPDQVFPVTVRKTDEPGTNGEQVYAVAVQKNGRVLVGGDFTQVKTYSGPLARFTTLGSPDPTFEPNLPKITGKIRAIAVDQKGRILIGGDFDLVSGSDKRHGFARLHPTGQLDTFFGPNNGGVSSPSGPVATVNAIAIRGLTVVIGGDFGTVNNDIAHPSPNVARLIMNDIDDGKLDTGFSTKNNVPAGTGDPSNVPTGPVNSVAIDAMDRVVIGGQFKIDRGNGHYYQNFARLTSTGTVDTTLGPSSTDQQPEGPSLQVNVVRIDSAGNILLAGVFTQVKGLDRQRIARWTAAGLDGAFQPKVDGPIRAMELDEAGRIVIGGVFEHVSQPRQKLARLAADGSLDTSFHMSGNPNTNTQLNGAVNAVAPRAFPCDSIVVGGAFSIIDSQTRSHIARLYWDGTFDSHF